MTKQFSLIEILENSGDSEFIQGRFENGCLEMKFEISELDCEALFEIKTDCLYSKFNSLHDISERTCFLELASIRDELKIENGFYIPDNDFSGLMRESKKCSYLAYGKRAAQYEYIFRVLNYETQLACLVANKGDILVSITS